MNGLPQKEWYRITEICLYLDVGDSTVRRWIEFGRLEAYKIGGQIKISREAIDKFISECRINPLD